MKFLSVILSLVILGLLLLTLVTQKIPPASIGVKQVVFGPGKGVVQEDFRTGLVLALPSYHRWHLLPRQTHFLHFVSGKKLRDSKNISRGIEDWQQPLELRLLCQLCLFQLHSLSQLHPLKLPAPRQLRHGVGGRTHNRVVLVEEQVLQQRRRHVVVGVEVELAVDHGEQHRGARERESSACTPPDARRRARLPRALRRALGLGLLHRLRRLEPAAHLGRVPRAREGCAGRHRYRRRS